jgi:hypothetical protein
VSILALVEFLVFKKLLIRRFIIFLLSSSEILGICLGLVFKVVIVLKSCSGGKGGNFLLSFGSKNRSRVFESEWVSNSVLVGLFIVFRPLLLFRSLLLLLLLLLSLWLYLLVIHHPNKNKIKIAVKIIIFLLNQEGSEGSDGFVENSKSKGSVSSISRSSEDFEA